MATVLKRRRLANPGGKRSGRRRMTPKQIKYFGTKRQRAALKAKRRVSSGSRRTTARRRATRAAGRQANIGEIVSIGLNPGERKESMARARKRTTRRRKRNPSPRVVRRTRRRNRGYAMSNPRRRRRRVRRRRNPSMLTSTATTVLGVLGGAAVTKLIVDRLPYNLNVGLPSYISTGVVAVIQGMAVSKFGKNQSLGDAMTLGGFTYLGLKILQEFAPGVAAISPIGLRGRGMGVIAPSSFYNPQVPRTNAMTRFVTPSAIPAPAAVENGMSGLGRRVPRMGRMS